MVCKNIVFLLLSAALPAAAASAYHPTEEGQLCLECHEDKSLSISFGNGEEGSVFVDTHTLGNSVHRDLDCGECHKGFSSEKHPHPNFATPRAFKEAAARLCTECHSFGQGIHATMLKGLQKLVCIDCHGGHNVERISPEATCLGCHKYRLPMTFADGTTDTIEVHPEDLTESVHKAVACNECHAGFSRREHPKAAYQGRRDLTIKLSDSCRPCHFDKFTRTVESIHYELLKKGHLEAPVCVDCHGSHAIAAGSKEKVQSARRCQKCHASVYETYVQSVHGEALVSDHNQDVPVCSDCHTAHSIADPRTTDFRNRTPELCGGCHANKELMAKYGLSTSVLGSYLEDFHGVTVTFYRKQGSATKRIAVCTDCHGIHDIASSKGPNSPAVKAKLLGRCQKCHPDATENFPDAWISHYEPTLKRAPLVFLVDLGYKIFIPFMIAGLLLQILLHVWRYTVNR